MYVDRRRNKRRRRVKQTATLNRLYQKEKEINTFNRSDNCRLHHVYSIKQNDANMRSDGEYEKKKKCSR